MGQRNREGHFYAGVCDFMISINQGAESNHSGSGLEQYIEHEFRSRGVLIQDFGVNANNQDLFVPRMLIRRVPYTSIYGCKSVSEFVFTDGPIAVRIECRRQDVPGSVDEKLPYLLANAVEAMPETNVWFVMDGSGARQKAIDWLRRKCMCQAGKNIRVYDLSEARLAIKSLLLKRQV